MKGAWVRPSVEPDTCRSVGLVIWERRDHPGLESFLFISVIKSSNFIWPWASEGVVNIMDSLEPFREQFLLN